MLSEEFLSHFRDLEDPRHQGYNYRHNLESILAISILATICGADNYVEIASFASSR